MIRAIMHGCNGRMGQVITGLVKADEAIEFVAGVDTYTGLANDYPVFDSIASVVICLFIIKVSVDIFREALSKMTDKSCSREFEDELKEFICTHNGVESIDLLKTRKFGEKVYVDLEIGIDGEMKLVNAHNISAQIHAAVENRFPEIKHIMIHMNPVKK